MRAVRFVIALLLAFLVHLVAMRFLPSAARSIDLFLIVIAVNAIDGSLAAATIGGLAAGLAADTLSGAFYGLHGFAGTATGFLTALVARQLVLQQLAVIGLLFAVAGVFHEVVLAGLLRLLLPEPPAPDFAWVGVRAAVSATCGVLAIAAWGSLRRRFSTWRRGRRRRVKMS